MRTLAVLNYRCLAGAVLLAAAAWAGAAAPVQAQAAHPADSPGNYHVTPGTLVYLDGQLSTADAIDKVPNEAVATVEGLHAPHGVGPAYADSTATRVVVLTTKAREYAPATLTLADRAHLQSAFTTRPASWQQLAPAALAYITAHYPKHWLGGELLELTRKSTGAVTYRVQLADNWGYRYVSFTAAGDFVPTELRTPRGWPW